jgi:hypothetical protein
VPSAIIFHFSGSLVFSRTFQVGTPASINASSNRFPASIKTAGSVQSPAGSCFHSVSATRPSREGANCDTCVNLHPPSTLPTRIARCCSRKVRQPAIDALCSQPRLGIQMAGIRSSAPTAHLGPPERSPHPPECHVGIVHRHLDIWIAPRLARSRRRLSEVTPGGGTSPPAFYRIIT